MKLLSEFKPTQFEPVTIQLNTAEELTFFHALLARTTDSMFFDITGKRPKEDNTGESIYNLYSCLEDEASKQEISLSKKRFEIKVKE